MKPRWLAALLTTFAVPFRPAILALAAFVLNAAVHGAQVDVFVVAEGQGQREESRARGVVVAELSGDASAGSSHRIERAVAFPGQISLELDPDKVWRLSFESAGFWTEPRTLLPEKGEAVRLTAWPTGALTGLVAVPRGESLPEELSLRFEPSAGTLKEGPDERGFFHFKAVPAGSYMVSAEQPTASPSTASSCRNGRPCSR